MAIVIKKCKCGNEYKVAEWELKCGRKKYCSKECMYKFRQMPKRGIGSCVLVKENSTWFKKGNISWNKGLAGRGICKPNNGSIKKGEKRGVNTQFKKGMIPLNWKGDNVGYFSLHRWVQNKKGKASICIQCGSITNVQWANVSKEYKRDLNDYIALCCKCHRKYDIDTLGAATKKFNLPKNKKCKKK